MAFWVVGGGERLPFHVGEDHAITPDLYVVGGKRRVGHPDDHHIHDDYGHDDDYPLPKRPRLSHLTPEPDPVFPPRGSIPVRNLSFLVIREQTSPPPPPAATEIADADVSPSAMERTASGLSISSDTSTYNIVDDDGIRLLDDDTAARLVEDRLQLSRRRKKDTQHERILRSLIRPRSRHAEFSIDNAALESIFSAANEIFFNCSLSQRVTWDWSHESSAQYQDHIIGTTALRRSKLGGFETLIVLSDPILRDRRFNRRLLISTFLHELIHSYLFIKCGIKARHCGGHTPGFRRIAGLIDLWAGSDNLHLRDMEADLDHFREDDSRPTDVDAPCVADASSRATFLHHTQVSIVPREHCFHDSHSHDRPTHQPHDAWGHYIDDHREYFQTSRGSSPTSTIPTITEGEFDEVESLEEGEIREPRGRLFFHDDYVPSRHSSAHAGRHYDSHDGRWSRSSERRGLAATNHDIYPNPVIIR
ncbi:hypothetical protein CPLU01_02390 [Colletotrichum plurivorum]|uniref:SprT-like domain-containing protein n=1 Tax=Colletotrichum plurivorum TaxID=2175906 RepID=A0A8H6KVT9_9PEZI|nr:hypothetical protein CPLU01_02390 [Colletotrichum plurivorum]